MPKPRQPSAVLAMLQRLVATRRRVVLLVLLCLAYGLYSARDVILLKVLRHQLAKLPGAEITVATAHLHPLLNGVTLGGVQVFRPADVGRPGPAGRKLRLAEVTELEARWPWLSLLRGGLVCQANVRGVDATVWRIAKLPPLRAGEKAPKNPVKEIAPEPPPPETLVAAWPEIARFVLPMAIDSVEVKNARFWLRDCTTDPEVKFPVEGIEVMAHNLTNRERLADGHYATVDASARPAGGKWSMHMELDPMAKAPTFGLRSKVDDVVLFRLNPVLRAYAKLDVEAGTFNTEMDIRSENGSFRGYVAPRIVGMRIRPRAEDDKEDSLLNRLWRTSVRAVTSLVENSKEETIATRLPVSGKFVSPEISVWEAVTTLFGNAYLRALQPNIKAVDALPLLKPKNSPARAAPVPAPKDEAPPRGSKKAAKHGPAKRAH